MLSLLNVISYSSQNCLTTFSVPLIKFLSSSISASIALSLLSDSALIFINSLSCCFFFTVPITENIAAIHKPTIIMAIPTSITGTTSTPPITVITIPAIIPGTHEFLYNLALSSLACSFSLARSSFISLPTIEFCLFCAEIQIS